MSEKMKDKYCKDDCPYATSTVFNVKWRCSKYRVELKPNNKLWKIYRCSECLKKEKSQ